MKVENKGSCLTILFITIFLITLIACSDSGEKDPKPTYGISLSQTQIYTFPSATQDYETQNSLSVIVTNTGNQATGDLNIELSGDDTSSFTLSTTSLASIPVNGNSSFSIRPNDDLAAGIYIATVIVLGGHEIFAEFEISFAVVKIANEIPEIIIPSPTYRYETLPYRNDMYINIGNDYNLIYSACDNINNYYIFLLGHINYVPLAYRNAVIYNGQTPITIGYSHSNISETSIKQSIETAYENSITHNTTSIWNVTVEAGINVEWFEAKVSANKGGSSGWDETDTRSVAHTYETTLLKSSESTDSLETTIGNNNEAPGKYRYSFFTTTDVYYVLVTNKEKTQVIEAYTAICARPQASWAWGIDYEPDVGGTFGKTAEGDLLMIPSIVLSELPDPIDEYNSDYTVTFNSNGGSVVNEQIVTSGSIAVRPTNPILDDLIFIDWYKDYDLKNVYDFSTPVTDNITLYAKWGVKKNLQENFQYSRSWSLSSEVKLPAIIEVYAIGAGGGGQGGHQYSEWFSDYHGTGGGGGGGAAAYMKFTVTQTFIFSIHVGEGGNGGYNANGQRGGDGQVIIVVTWYE